MITIAICEDEKTYAEYIRDFVAEVIPDVQITYFSDAENFYDSIKHKKYDLYLLDIEMPKKNGIEIAREIRNYYKKTIIIFLTNYEEYVYDGYEVNAFRYIPKNLVKEKLKPALESAYKEYQDNNSYIFITDVDGKQIKVNIYDVICIEKELKNVVYYTKNGVIRSAETLKSALKNFTGKRIFIEINRAVVINVNHIYDIDKLKVTMDNNHELYISRDRSKQIRRDIFNAMGE